MRKCESAKVRMFEGEKAERWEGAKPVIRGGRRAPEAGDFGCWMLNFRLRKRRVWERDCEVLI